MFPKSQMIFVRMSVTAKSVGSELDSERMTLRKDKENMLST